MVTRSTVHRVRCNVYLGAINVVANGGTLGLVSTVRRRSLLLRDFFRVEDHARGADRRSN